MHPNNSYKTVKNFTGFYTEVKLIIALGVVFTQLYKPSNIFACMWLVLVNHTTEYAHGTS